jgi:hypothetical protein
VLLFSEARPPPASDSRRGTALAGALTWLEVEAGALVPGEAFAGAAETAAPAAGRGESPEISTGLSVVALKLNVETPISIFRFLALLSRSIEIDLP